MSGPTGKPATYWIEQVAAAGRHETRFAYSETDIISTTLHPSLEKAYEVATDLYDLLVKQGRFTKVEKEPS